MSSLRCLSPFSGRFTINHLSTSPLSHFNKQTAVNSSLDTFATFFIGKMVTLGIPPLCGFAVYGAAQHMGQFGSSDGGNGGGPESCEMGIENQGYLYIRKETRESLTSA